MNWAMMLTAISITVWQRIRTPTGEDDPLKFLSRGDFLPAKCSKMVRAFARAADHAQEPEGLVNPIGQHHGIVAMAARDDEAETGGGGQRPGQQLLPIVRAQGCLQPENIGC